MRFVYRIFLIFAVVVNFFIPEVFASKNEGQFLNEIGLTLSRYKYKEPGPDVTVKATNLGIDYIASLTLGKNYFVRGNVIAAFAVGGASYSCPSSGDSSGEPNRYIDLRGFFGRDIAFENFILDSYMGLGYRYLYNDARGLTNIGKAGYRRESHYFYLPIGLSHKFRITETSKLITTLEFDWLLFGKQKSYLGSDTKSASFDINNKQHCGYGVRGNVMYKVRNWLIGPYVNYWNIDDSDSVYDGATGKSWLEPRNNTLEAGLKLSYKFSGW